MVENHIDSSIGLGLLDSSTVHSFIDYIVIQYKADISMRPYILRTNII